METFCHDEENKEGSLKLITHIRVQPVHTSDANALVPATESTENENLKPKGMILIEEILNCFQY